MRPIERAQAIKDMTSFEWNRGKGGKLDKVRGQQKLVIDKEPEFIYDKNGDVVGVDAWVRLFDGSGKEVKIDPHRRIANPPTVPRSGIVETGEGENKRRELTPNPSEAFYEAVWDSVSSAPNPKGWRTRGTVTTIFGNTGDGRVDSTSANYSSARSGTDLGTRTSFEENVGQLQSVSLYQCTEIFIGFDTSSIVDTDSVSAVDLALWLVSDSSVGADFLVEARAKSWGPSLTTADWVSGASLGGLTLLASTDTSIIGATGSYKTFTSEDAILTTANMKTGIVDMLLCSSRHRIGNQPSASTSEYVVFRLANNTGTTQDPKLTITHAAPFTPSIPRFTVRPNRIWRLH